MSFYQQERNKVSGLEKDASSWLGKALSKMYSTAQGKAKSMYNTVRTPGYIKDKIKGNIPEIAGATTFGAGAAYLGNQQYKNALPEVRSLPRLEMPPMLDQN